jgi:hypothetical protein
MDSFKLYAGMRLQQSALPNGDDGEWEFSTELSRNRLRITTIARNGNGDSMVI